MGYSLVMSSDPKPPLSTVYYDGDCPMCRAFVATVKDAPQGERLHMVDFSKTNVMAAFSQESLKKEIHLIDEHGRVYKGAEAVFKALWDSNSRWRIVGLLYKFPPFRPFLRMGYRFIAKHRLGFSKLLGWK